MNVEGEESNFSDPNGPSESNLINGFTSLDENEKGGESVAVTEDSDPKKYTESFNSLPDVQGECARPLYQECDTSSDMLEESSQRTPQTSQRAYNPIAMSHGGQNDGDVVSLVDIEASLEHIQSNGSGSAEEMLAESLQSSNDDMKVSQCAEQSEKSAVISCEFAGSFNTTVRVEEDRSVSLDDVNQMECDKSNPASDSLDEKIDGTGLSDYAIMPGELTNQLVEGPCITLPPSELQSQIVAGSSKNVHSETMPQSEIVSVQKSEDTALPNSSTPSDVFPIQRSTTDTVVPENNEENVKHHAVDITSEERSTAPENSSSSEAKSDTTTNTASVTNHAPVKQKVKKTPHDFIFGKVVGEGSYSTVMSFAFCFFLCC